VVLILGMDTPQSNRMVMNDASQRFRQRQGDEGKVRSAALTRWRGVRTLIHQLEI
jgi:hypothetical protein